MAASAQDLIGREVSLPVPGSRKRERGHVAEATKDGLIVHLYPEQDEKPRERVVAPDEPRLLKDWPLSGWYAVHLLTEDGQPHISLRFRPYVIEAVKRIAAERGTDIEEAFNHLLRLGLEIHERG